MKRFFLPFFFFCGLSGIRFVIYDIDRKYTGGEGEGDYMGGEGGNIIGNMGNSSFRSKMAVLCNATIPTATNQTFYNRTNCKEHTEKDPSFYFLQS